MYVDPDEMTHYATQRNEDGMICQAVRYLVEEVGMMPASYWGELSWSETCHEKWSTAVRWRLKEAKAARHLLFDTSDTLLQALADYTHTDVTASGELGRSVDGVPAGLAPYFRKDVRDDGRYTIGTYRSGGHRKFNAGYGKGDGDVPFTSAPPGNPDLISHEVGGGPIDNYTVKPADGHDDQLWYAMQKWGQFLAMIEKEVAALDPSVERVYSTYLLPTFRTRPVMIKRHGEELLVGYEAYDDVAQRVARGNEHLLDSWKGDGAASFKIHSKHALLGYVNRCKDEIKWLGNQTKIAAEEIQQMRNGVAAAIYEHAPKIRARYRDYAGVWENITYSVIHVFGGDASGAAVDLLQAVKYLADEMSDISAMVPAAGGDSGRAALDELDLPDFASKGHTAKPPVVDDSPHAGDWRHPSEWA